jgi:hypothetical protein
MQLSRSFSKGTKPLRSKDMLQSRKILSSHESERNHHEIHATDASIPFPFLDIMLLICRVHVPNSISPCSVRYKRFKSNVQTSMPFP